MKGPRPWLWILGIMAAYAFLAGGILTLLPLLTVPERANFDSSDILAILSGAVTAGALGGIVVQIHYFATQNRKSLIEGALRADNLHSEFELPDMRSHRGKAYFFLKANRAQLDKLGTWFLDVERNYEGLKISDEMRRYFDSNAEDGDILRESFISLSAMFSFFHRVWIHLSLYENDLHSVGYNPSFVLSLFFYGTWSEAGLSTLNDKIEEAFLSLDEETRTRKGKPYYIDAVKDLDAWWIDVECAR